MADFDTLNTARGALFQAVNRAVNNAAFALPERIALNELLADPLAADHLLLARAIVEAKPPEALAAVEEKLVEATRRMRRVLAGENARDQRRDAIDQVDAASDALTALLD
ncbi:hypothetical protein [Sandaracinobacteroides saxicola]|uniref:Uncharacterized protein n=1 Tax=Sandaracinobacteroides saxicola TaxID=2759707 RepID=A0A7G5IH26_9SPHN|nr:hypothetical protein [Sandaracinobacteroides saxicola]QMW22668.1 hypothetical protein H3309_15400 [Sandaracinobacteroides saxicola]